MGLFGDLLVSKARADILDYLTQHCTREVPVSTSAIHDKFSKLHSLDRGAVSLALDDLRHLGLIEISAGVITLTLLAKRLLR
jgi:hypothetical protein